MNPSKLTLIDRIVQYRKTLIVISILICAGGAFNDGWSEWFFAVPFLHLLYKTLRVSTWKKVLLCGTIFVAMVTVSNLKYESSLVFPVIGQQVKLLEDIPVISYPGTPTYYDIYPESGIHSDESVSGIVSKNTVFFVKRIDISNADFGTSARFVLVNATEEIVVKEYTLTTGAYIKADQEKDKAFCKKVEWEFCNTVPTKGTDPMFKLFRWLASLMYYPMGPIAIMNGFLMHIYKP